MKFKINKNCNRAIIGNQVNSYQQINRKLEISLDEAEKVKFLFNKYVEYEEHPLLELIKIEIASALEKKVQLPYKEAKQKIIYIKRIKKSINNGFLKKSYFLIYLVFDFHLCINYKVSEKRNN